MPRAFFVLALYLIHCCSLGKRTGIYFLDSSKLEVCHPKRAYQHQVFKGVASWGKSSMGWFFGLKIHLVVNQFGELINFGLTSGKIADNNTFILLRIAQYLMGWIFGDRGYLLNPDKRAFLEKEGLLRFFSKCRKNMKKQGISFAAQSWLGKRNIIETVIGVLKQQCDIAHTRHRSPYNAMGNVFAGLCAYTFLERKPVAKVNLEKRMIAMPSDIQLAA